MIYITGDIHREQDIHKINPREFIAGRTLTDQDYVIICGDFGCIWDGGNGDRFWLKWLESLPWNTLFVDGNHENFDVLNTYPIVEWHGGKVHQIRKNVFHLMRGEIFDIDGLSFFSFGGGFSHDVQYRTEKLNWWQDELPTQEEVDNAYSNLENHKWNVDYVLSHDIFVSHPLAKKYELSLEPYQQRVDIQSVLEDIQNKLDYKLWFHGHYHTDCQYNKCITLFDRVVLLDNIDDELKTIKKIKK